MNHGDPFRLEGKVAMVTGAGRGIGAAIALAMADAGADVGLVARTECELEEVADGIRSRGRRAAVIVEDLSATSDVVGVVDRMVGELGSLDLLVNNAGGAQPAPFVDTSGVQLDEAFHFNVTATFELVKAAVPHLLQGEGSSVVNVSSNMGHLTQRGLLVYGTVKAALSHLTRLLAADLAPRIRVNAVAPASSRLQAYVLPSPTRCTSASSKPRRSVDSPSRRTSRGRSCGSRLEHRATSRAR